MKQSGSSRHVQYQLKAERFEQTAVQQKIYETTGNPEDAHWWSRCETLKKTLDIYAPPIENPCILEANYASDGNLELLSYFGELPDTGADNGIEEFAHKCNLYSIREESLPDSRLFNIQFDIICLFDVLEHVENDIGALKALNKLLTQEGVIIVTAPAYNMLWVRDAPRLHQRRYTPSQLAALARTAGLKVADNSHFSRYFRTSPVYVLSKING